MPAIRRLFRLCLVLLLIQFCAPLQAAEIWKLTVLHSNDLHGMMKPFDYPGQFILQPARKDAGGLARRATLIKRLRTETGTPLVLVDSGDVFTRGPWQNLFYGLPEIEAMNLMGYDLMTVGNNEFKVVEGKDAQDRMLTLLRRSRFPWLAANLTVGGSGLPVPGVQPFVVRSWGGIRVGFLGLTAPRAADYPQTAGWTISDPLEAAARWVPTARKECDILIAVTHIGLALDRRLVEKVPGLDAVVAGDCHTFLRQPLRLKAPDGREVPVVEAGEQGIFLGRLDLTFEKDKTWRLIRSEGSLIPIDASLPEDDAVKALIEGFLKPAELEKTGRLITMRQAA